MSHNNAREQFSAPEQQSRSASDQGEAQKEDFFSIFKRWQGPGPRHNRPERKDAREEAIKEEESPSQQKAIGEEQGLIHQKAIEEKEQSDTSKAAISVFKSGSAIPKKAEPVGPPIEKADFGKSISSPQVPELPQAQISPLTTELPPTLSSQLQSSPLKIDATPSLWHSEDISGASIDSATEQRANSGPEGKGFNLPSLEKYGTIDVYLDNLCPALCDALGLDCNKEVLFRELQRYFAPPNESGPTVGNAVDLNKYVSKLNITGDTQVEDSIAGPEKARNTSKRARDIDEVGDEEPVNEDSGEDDMNTTFGEQEQKDLSFAWYSPKKKQRFH